MYYTDKYLKYKNKYLELKNQVGGYDIAELNLPDDSVNSFFKEMLLFLNNYNKKVSYFELLKIAGKKDMFIAKDNNSDTDIHSYIQNIANNCDINITVWEITNENKINEHMLKNSNKPLESKIYDCKVKDAVNVWFTKNSTDGKYKLITSIS